jgi:uncharacterized membrane protein (UPF0127 family)
MSNRLSWAVFALVALLFISCREDKLTVIDLVVRDVTVKTEVARTPLEKEKGLMFRKILGENEGMLFFYEADQRLSFWMRNTYLPLSIAFISADGVITQIEDMRPLDETTIVSIRSVRYALEANRGAFARWGAVVGDRVVFPADFEK